MHLSRGSVEIALKIAEIIWSRVTAIVCVMIIIYICLTKLSKETVPELCDLFCSCLDTFLC